MRLWKEKQKGACLLYFFQLYHAVLRCFCQTTLECRACFHMLFPAPFLLVRTHTGFCQLWDDCTGGVSPSGAVRRSPHWLEAVEQKTRCFRIKLSIQPAWWIHPPLKLTNRIFMPLKIGRAPKGNEKVFQPSIFRCKLAGFVSGSVSILTFPRFFAFMASRTFDSGWQRENPQSIYGINQIPATGSEAKMAGRQSARKCR